MKLIFKLTTLAISAALILSAAFLAYVAIPYFGNKALIVRSGSMQPAVGVGDLVVVHAQNALSKPAPGLYPKYKVGDIVAFKGEKDPKTLTTHRVASVQTQNGQVFYVTKGDANNTPDTNLVPEGKIVGKSIFNLPNIGKIFALVKTKAGFISLVVVPAILVIILELFSIFKEIFRGKKKDNLAGNYWQAYPTVVKVFLPIVIGIMFFQSSFASYADTEQSNGNSLQASGEFGQQGGPVLGDTASPTPTPEPITDHLVISEVQIDRGTNDLNDHDFIEIYNPTSSPINLAGYRLVKRGAGSSTENNIVAYTPTNTIPAHGFFLWAHSQGTNTYAATIGADISSPATLASDNSIAIRLGAVGTGTIIDALSWDGSATLLKEGLDFFPDPGNDQSMERNALSTSTAITMLGSDSLKGNGFDSGSNALDFTLRLISQPQNSSSPPEAP